jgi:aldehyde dehydrogenase (NAD+)
MGSNRIKEIFEAQKANQLIVAARTAKQRKATLKRLKKAIEVTYRQEIRDALFADFNKPAEDVDLTETYLILSEIKNALSHLNQWMAPDSVSTPMALFGSKSEIIYEPKGVCLIISPWNFPFNLTFCPLVSAIAAGNTAMIKPSEMTPHSSKLIKKIVDDVFEENEVAVCEGAIEISTELLELPFNHIFFTGSPQVGKIVMAAAAKNLSSVTLELGGKSPVIVDETANIKTTAKRLMWGKFINTGQICIAPDYLYVHEQVKDELIKECKSILLEHFGDEPSTSKDYARVVNQKHTERVASYLEDAKNKGAKVLVGGDIKIEESYIAPTLVEHVPLDSGLMQNEIFGPILPIIPYSAIEEVLAFINKGEKPLALYIYSKSNKNINHIIKNTRAGGTCINNNNVQFSNGELPFGGSNNSGIGKAHGYFGFQEFSNARGVLRQYLPSTVELFLRPPYTDFKRKVIDLTLKYF